jgi:hypothetical protein
MQTVKLLLEDDNLESDDSNPGKDDGTPAFLEDRNSDLITYEEKKQLYLTMRGWWNDNIDSENPPINWSSTGKTQPALLVCGARQQISAFQCPFALMVRDFVPVVDGLASQHRRSVAHAPALLVCGAH